MSERPTFTGTLQCSECNTANPGSREYCGQCGKSLWYSCPRCTIRSPLSEKFCGSCGTNLAEIRERHKKEIRSQIERLDQLVAEHQYDDAILMAKFMVRSKDAKHAEVATYAASKLNDIQAAKDQAVEHAAGQLTVAQARFKSFDYPGTIAAIELIPEPMRNADATRIYDSAKSAAREQTSLRKEISEGLKTNPLSLLPSIVRLQELTGRPDAKLTALTQQIRAEILKRAKARLEACQFSECQQLLRSIPESIAGGDVESILQSVDRTIWLETNAKKSPFADNNLLDSIQLLQKFAPKDVRVPKLLANVSARLKEQGNRALHSFAPWAAAPPQPFFKFPVRFLNPLVGLTENETTIPAAIKEHGVHRFTTAIGLALQLVKQGEIQEAIEPAAKASIFNKSLFGSKPTVKEGWGISCDQTGLKAVKISLGNKGEVRITEAALIEFEGPPSHLRSELEHRGAIRNAFAALQSRFGFKNEPCLLAFSTIQTLSRFMSFPAVAEKQLNDMIALDTKAAIPFAPDEIYTYNHRFPVTDNSQIPVFVLGTRRAAVDDLIAIVKQHGISVTGIQSDAVALHNLIRFKCGVANTPDRNSIILNIGSDNTTIVFSSKGRMWSRSIPIGGSRVTLAVARESKTAFQDAEKLKKSPFRASDFYPVVLAIDRVLRDFSSEVLRTIEVAKREGAEADNAEILLTGGGSLLHGVGRALVFGPESIILEE